MTDAELIEDGFGSCWAKCGHPHCGLHVVRPGKCQCDCEAHCTACGYPVLWHLSGCPEFEELYGPNPYVSGVGYAETSTALHAAFQSAFRARYMTPPHVATINELLEQWKTTDLESP